MAIVPYRRLAAAMEKMATARDRKQVGYMIDRNFDELCDVCGGCTYGFNGYQISDVDILSTAGDTILVAAPDGNLGDHLYPTDAPDLESLPAGIWMISGQIIASFAVAATGTVDVSEPSGGAAGGVITGQDYVVTATEVHVPFSGVLLQETVWAPGVTVFNGTDQTITSVVIRYHAYGTASECGHQVTSPGA